ncbi:acetyl-CoA hydrolase/transferase family protein [Caenispirillum bisanense]|uniref:acetyl-CoA hydrolase/transferase family protein n=1 Tax=Caenispirillum bisanense TaxID=414052 RepID=UPI0031DC0866
MSYYATMYQDKLCSAADAAKLVNDRENLVLGMGTAMPPAIMAAVAERVKRGEFTRLPVYYMHASDAAVKTLLVPELMDVVKPHPLFMSAFDRALAKKGYEVGKEYIHFVPCAFHQAGKLLTEEIGADCFVVQVSPMDRAGYFSLGTSPDYGATVVRNCKRLIVEVNPNMPRTFGECLLHVSEVDAVVEHTSVLMEAHSKDASVEDEKIAAFIAEHIPDGATLQMGIGGVPNSVMSFLSNHKDLGLHSELFSPAMVDLIKKGVLNGKRKKLFPFKHVYTLALGDREMFDFMNDNPSIVGYPVAWVNNPAVIAKNNDMISVNGAIEVDLTGQIGSEFVAGHQFSGTGGQLDFVRGAYAAKGGKSFIALHSTAKNGQLSRIVPRLSGPVTDPRMDTHHVVTEHGLANLKGKSMQERAELLIGLAAPQFRDELMIEAKKLGLM